MARTETTIDRFGRVLIPKKLRRELGLDAGTRMRLQVGGEVGETPLREIEGVLVDTGKLEGDPDKVLDEVHAERLHRLGGVG
ncbi:MAG TPA: AbrB/MazE/SpoVT family DNA-binding domain-containing protein [Thermoanaerobaculia bacterium]|nr:AbrB/MazE/SpoVT family DNA-binding domain-containing protein [Thermoanaerobaculia bacterium]